MSRAQKQATIERIEGDGNPKLRADSGREVEFNARQHPHLDYGYAVMSDSNQRQTRLANVRYLARLPSALADLTFRQEDVLSNTQPAACTLGPSALLAVYFY